VRLVEGAIRPKEGKSADYPTEKGGKLWGGRKETNSGRRRKYILEKQLNTSNKEPERVSVARVKKRSQEKGQSGGNFPKES